MTRSTLRPILGGALLALSFAASAVAADNWYAVTKLHNSTPFELRFQYRFGAEDVWRHGRVRPGHTDTFWFKYRHANADNSPGLDIKLDVDMTRDLEVREYHLVAHACPDHEGRCGGHYGLVFERGERRLRVVSE